MHMCSFFFLPYTVLSQSVLLGLRFIHNSVFSLPPSLCSDWNLCYPPRLFLSYTTYLTQPERIPSRSLFYFCTPIGLFRLIIYTMVLYWTRSHSFIRFRGCGTTISFPNKRSGREVQPLAALYPTVRLSPWRQVRKNIHSRVATPGTTRSCLPLGGLLSWSPYP